MNLDLNDEAALQNALVTRDDTMARVSNDALGAKAARMHKLCSARAANFTLPSLADQPMAVMLTLYIAELQSRPLRVVELAQANTISRPALDGLMGELIQAGLIVISGQDPVLRLVGLSPIGSARMRGYLDTIPVV